MPPMPQRFSAEARLKHVVQFAHRELRLGAACVSEFRGGRLLFRAVAGDAASFNIALGHGVPEEDTYGRRMLAGEIPGLIPDADAEPHVAHLPGTRANRIGAYVGVPINGPGGEALGVLAAVSHQARPALDERAVEFLQMLSALIVVDLEDQNHRQEVRESILAFVDTGGFEIAYQPIFDLLSGGCVGLEALARFPQPFVGPRETFATAAEVGLGLELERAAAHRACQIVPSLAAGQFVAVNVSPTGLRDMARRVRNGENFPLSRIVAEVTEHSAISAYATLRDELEPLRERGLRIAVDDAGAGYASLRHILELRPDFIKLDQWLVDGLAYDRGRRVAVSAFVALARELGSVVIAEGIERAEDLAAVRELGLHGAQGFFLGRPSTDREVVGAWCSGAAGHATGDSDRGLKLLGGNLSSPPARSPVAVSEAPGRRPVQRELERFELDGRVSQRLEAVGQLAAGIAHEINTPLQYVGDSVTFLKEAVDELMNVTGLFREVLHAEPPIAVDELRRAMRAAEDEADVEYLTARIPAAFARTIEGVDRVRSIVQAMKRFSHTSGAESAPADINQAIETTLAVCRNEYKYVAEVDLELGNLPVTECNIGEINQVLLNLIINAAHAIEEKSNGNGALGHIRIATRAERDAVVITIVDDGTGIPPALLDRIYEPFFTTKAVGKGTGQGLAIALATIQRHGGSLDCSSRPGEGTTFRIRLPLHRATSELQGAA